MITTAINNPTKSIKQTIIDLLEEEKAKTKNKELSNLLKAWKQNETASLEEMLSKIEEKDNLNPIILTLINELEYNDVMSIEEFETNIQDNFKAKE